MSKKEWFQKDFHTLLLVHCRSTDRSTVGRTKLLCRSIERSTDMHQSALVHFGRPGGRPTARSLLSVGSDRPPRLTDRELCSLVRNNGRPTGRPLSPMVENLTVGGRPAGRRQKDYLLIFSQQLYSILSFFNDSFRFSPHVFIPYK